MVRLPKDKDELRIELEKDRVPDAAALSAKMLEELAEKALAGSDLFLLLARLLFYLCLLQTFLLEP